MTENAVVENNVVVHPELEPMIAVVGIPVINLMVMSNKSMCKKNKMQYTSDITQPFTALYLYLLLDSRVSPSVKLIRHFPKLLWFITTITDEWSYLCERYLIYLCYMKGLLYSILLQLYSCIYVGSLLHILSQFTSDFRQFILSKIKIFIKR